MNRERRTAARVALVALLLSGAVALAVVAARGPAPPRTSDERVREVASTLRCPVCQNLSVADSSSRLAQEMRAEIARDLREGRSEDEIREAFVDAYGEWILLSPPRRGIGLLPWVAPMLLLAGGAAAVVFLIRRWARRDQPSGVPRPSLTAHERQMLERSMADGDGLL